MSIQTAIQAAQQKVEACYTQVATQGGTIPTTKNLANLPQAISTVSESYIPNYIAPKSNVGGVYKSDNTATSFSLDGATNVYQYALTCAFQGCTNLTSVDLSSLTTLSGSYAMQNCFQNCTGLTGNLDLGSLTTISGIYAMQFCFYGCTNLTSVSLSSLITLSGNTAMGGCFQGCTGLTSVDLSSLITINSATAMGGCFQGCTGLTTVTIGGTTAIDFGTKTNQFSNMFSDCNQASGIDLYIATTQEKLSTFTGYDTSGNNHHFGATCEVRIHYTAQ